MSNETKGTAGTKPAQGAPKEAKVTPVYNYNGKSMTEGFPDLPNDEAGSLQYESDGSVFKKPEGADTRIAAIRHELSGIKVAASKVQGLIDASKDMAKDETEEDMKAMYARAIAKQELALNAHNEQKVKLEAEMKELEFSLLTPKDRAVAKELAELIILRDKTIARISELQPVAKVQSGGTTSAPTETASTDEQKANHAAAIAKYQTQGKAIIAMAKEGKTNAEIARFLGIPPASVPGPKNAFLKSEAGAGWEVNDKGVMVFTQK